MNVFLSFPICEVGVGPMAQGCREGRPGSKCYTQVQYHVPFSRWPPDSRKGLQPLALTRLYLIETLRFSVVLSHGDMKLRVTELTLCSFRHRTLAHLLPTLQMLRPI